MQARAIRRAGELLEQIMPATGAHLKSAATDTLSRKLAGMPKAIAKCAWDVHGLKFDVFVS